MYSSTALSDNKYTRMQKAYYDNEGTTGSMNRENHKVHNANPDYWKILLSDLISGEFKDKKALDFGCGCGRNVFNFWDLVAQADGVDISPELIKTCKSNTEKMGINDKVNFHVCDGVSLECFEDESYDFIMSTIVLQHICVHNIRLSYLREFFRVLSEGGLLSFQMGYGSGHPHTRNYYDDYYEAGTTNSGCDVRVDNPIQIVDELKEIGFTDIHYEIRNSWSDTHSQWIFVKARKPSE